MRNQTATRISSGAYNDQLSCMAPNQGGVCILYYSDEKKGED